MLLDNGLRDYGRAALGPGSGVAEVAPGDLAQAKTLLTESYRFLFCTRMRLWASSRALTRATPARWTCPRAWPRAILAVSDCRTDLETLRRPLTGNANLLGFESNFLMLRAERTPGGRGHLRLI